MNVTSKFPSAAGKVSVDEALGAVRAGIDRMDAERAPGYAALAAFRSAKARLLERHEELLTRKLGADNPRVLEVQAQREAINAQLLDLHTAGAVAAVPTPEVDAAGYALHGFVRDAQRQPITGAAVALYDADGARRSDFKPAATDTDGYFKLVTAQLLASDDAKSRTGEQPLSVPLELRLFEAGRKQIQLAVPTINAIPGRADFAAIVAGPAVPPVQTPPDILPTGGARPIPSKSADVARSDLKTMVEELRMHPRVPPLQTRTAASPAKSSRKRNVKKRKSPAGPPKGKKPPKRKNPR